MNVLKMLMYIFEGDRMHPPSLHLFRILLFREDSGDKEVKEVLGEYHNSRHHSIMFVLDFNADVQQKLTKGSVFASQAHKKRSLEERRIERRTASMLAEPGLTLNAKEELYH
jgi:hypothetical protein